MTRQEEIRKVLDTYKFASVEDAFILGANWADTHPDNTAWLDKACEWLDKRITPLDIPEDAVPFYELNKANFINDFKKAMEQ